MAYETAVEDPAEGGTTKQPAVESEAKVEDSQAEPTLEELRAALATEKAAREKAEHDLNSVRGQLKGRLNQEAFQQATRRHLTSIDATVKALVKGQVSGDPAQTEQALAELTKTSQEQEQTEAFDAEYVDILEGILDEAEDMGIDARLPNGSVNKKALQNAPELAEVLRLFDEGLASKNIRTGRQAVRAASAVRRQAQTAAWEKEQADERKRSGSLNTPRIQASGNGAKNLAQLEKDVAAGRIAMTPAISKQLEAYWNQ